MKITKKEYINGIAHDLQFITEELHTGNILTWWHGITYTRGELKAIQKDLKEEQAKINADKKYRPWND